MLCFVLPLFISLKPEESLQPHPPYTLYLDCPQAVEMEHNYGREWPRLVWEEGGPVLRPGFLQPFIDPDFAPYWLHRGIARLNISAADRVLQVCSEERKAKGGSLSYMSFTRTLQTKPLSISSLHSLTCRLSLPSFPLPSCPFLVAQEFCAQLSYAYYTPP